MQQSSRLALNTVNTDASVCTTARPQDQLPGGNYTAKDRIGLGQLATSAVLHLGIHVDLMSICWMTTPGGLNNCVVLRSPAIITAGRTSVPSVGCLQITGRFVCHIATSFGQGISCSDTEIAYVCRRSGFDPGADMLDSGFHRSVVGKMKLVCSWVTTAENCGAEARGREIVTCHLGSRRHKLYQTWLSKGKGKGISEHL